MSLYARLVASLLLVVAIVAGWHALTTHYDRQGYTRAKAEDKAAAELQDARNRDLQRQAELKYVVQAGTREKFIVQTVKEIHEAAAPLADCRIPDGVVRLLNDTARCALGDTAAACGPDGAVPKP